MKLEIPPPLCSFPQVLEVVAETEAPALSYEKLLLGIKPDFTADEQACVPFILISTSLPSAAGASPFFMDFTSVL